MKKKNLMLCLSLLLFAAAIFPQDISTSTTIVHQHRSYPDEEGISAGFNDDGILTSHLPIIILQTNNNVIPGADGPTTQELYCEFSVINNKTYINKSSDSPTQTGKIAINVRGNSSRYYPKKQYTLRTVDENKQSIRTDFLGMPKETNWVLNGSYQDPSLIRNYMIYNISSEIMDYAPRCRFCEVFIADSEGTLNYRGVYTLIEKPKVSKNRLNLTAYDPKYAETSFVVQMNKRIDDIKIDHLKPDNLNVYPFNLEYPGAEEITDASLQYIKKELLQFEKLLYDAEYTNQWDKVENCIDLNSFVDYYLINEFFQNYDAGIRSTYLYKNLGGKFSIGPVWDFDGAFNNFFESDFTPDMLEMQSTFYYSYLSQNEKFIERCGKRYDELRKTVFSEEYLLNYIDDSSKYLGSAALRNCNKWYEGNASSFYKDIEKMKTFVVKRGNWMDEYFKKYLAIVK